MLYYGLALLIIMFIIFIIKPKSLYSLIISMDLLAIVILIFADVLYIIKLDVYPYSSSLEYFLYRFMTKIPIGYFDIKVVVNVAFYIFLMSSVLFLGHDLKYVKRKNMRLIGLIFWGIIGGIDLLYLNSPHFSEKIYIMKYSSRSSTASILEHSIVSLNYILLFVCLYPCYKTFMALWRTKILFKRQRLNVLLNIRIVTSAIILCIAAFTPIRNIINDFDIYNFRIGMLSGILYHGYEVLVFALLIIIGISIVLFGPDILDAKVFHAQYPDPKNALVMLGDMRHIFHSYKNALLSIRLMSQKVIADYGSEQSLETLNEIITRIDEMVHRSGSFLDIYNRARLQFDCVTAQECVEKACKRVCFPEGYMLEKEYPEEKISFYGDGELITEALVNLLNNSVEALEKKNTKQKVIRICVWSEVPWLCISIWDNGTGIERKNRNKIFNPVFSTKQTYNNWGLGLAYVRNVVKEHSGYVNLDSKVGRYTEFQIILPVEMTQQA